MDAFLLSDSMESAVEFLIQITLKTSLLLLALLLADRFFGQRYAAWRNLLWKMGIVSALLIPLAAATLPTLQIPIAAVYDQSSDLEGLMPVFQTSDAPPLTAAEFETADLAADLADSIPARSTSIWWGIRRFWPGAVMGIFSLGAVLGMGFLLAGLLHTVQLRRRAEPIGDERWLREFQRLRSRLGIRRSVSFVSSDQVSVPTQIGFGKPAVLLPAGMIPNHKDHAIRAAIIHELAHVYHLDYLFNLLSGLALALNWFNPLVWFAVWRLKSTSEHACDDWAVELIGHYDIYADSLLDVTEKMKRETAFALSASMARTTQLASRIERISALAGKVTPRIGRATGVAFTGVLFLCASLLAASALSNAEGRLQPEILEIEINDEISFRMEKLLAEARVEFQKGPLKLLGQIAFEQSDEKNATEVEKRLQWVANNWDRNFQRETVVEEMRRPYSEALLELGRKAYNKRYCDLGIHLCDQGLKIDPEHWHLYSIKWLMLIPAKAVADSIPGVQVARWLAADLRNIEQRKFPANLGGKSQALGLMYQWTRDPVYLALLREVTEQYIEAFGDVSPLFSLARLETDPKRKAALLKRLLEGKTDWFARYRGYEDLIRVEMESPGTVSSAQIDDAFSSHLEAIHDPEISHGDFQMDVVDFYLLRAEFAVGHDEDIDQADKWLWAFDQIRKDYLEEINQKSLDRSGEPEWQGLFADAQKLIILGDKDRLGGNAESAAAKYREALELVKPSISGWTMMSELGSADKLKNMRKSLMARLDDPVLKGKFY